MEKQKMSVMKRVVLIILILILIAVALISIHTIRNFCIIKEMQNNFTKYADSNNYHIQTTTVQEDGLTSVVDFYKKGNKQLMVLERKDNEYAKISVYDTGETINMFSETKDEKIATLNTNKGMLNGALSNSLDEGTVGNHLFVSLMAKIRKVDLNGKECYRINNFLSGNFMHEENDEYYFERDTGFLLKNNFGKTQVTKEYEFDNVEDSVFVEPNIEEYKINKVE